MDYCLIDSGDRKKLESIGPYVLVRPAQAAVWGPSMGNSEWRHNVNGIFERDSSGGGTWKWFNGGVPKSWTVNFDIFKMVCKTTDFGHLGFFPEQYENWKWLIDTVSRMKDPVSALNLFAYSGGSSLAMASAGATVCHVDASKGMVEWARENLRLNPNIPDRIRWITDDVFKLVNREIKRGTKYNGIVLDPPSFGRGAQGQVWKMEDGIIQLLEALKQLVDPSKPFFVLLSCHSQGFSPMVLARILRDVFHEATEVSCGEMTIPEKNGKKLPGGFYARICKH